MTDSIIQRAVESNDPILAEKALIQIESLLNSSPDDEQRIYLLFSRANCHLVLENFEEARRDLDVALKARPDEASKTTYDWTHGVIAQRQTRYEEALAKFSAVLTAHSAQLRTGEFRFLYEDIQTRRAFLSVTQGKFRDAVPLLNESLAFEVSETVKSELFASLGLCYSEMDDFDSARSHLLEAIRLGLVGDWNWRAHYCLGLIDYHTDMFEDAKREFQQCEQFAATYAIPLLDLYGWLAVTCTNLGEISESARYSGLRKRN